MEQVVDNSNLLAEQTGYSFRNTPPGVKKICKAQVVHLLSAHQIRNMFNRLSNMMSRGGSPKAAPMYREAPSSPAGLARNPNDRKPTYSKVFRWRLPDGCEKEPATVEVVGSFTHWQRVPLMRDGKLDSWHGTIHHIEGNRTHHYMLLVDGQPTNDKNCDGYAVPHGPSEEQYSMPTPRGPRLFMLFAQTK
jgi:hypothetical protein